MLGPISDTSHDKSVVHQLVPLNVLRGMCEGPECKGNIANQRACFKQLQDGAQILLSFGVEDDRPYIWPHYKEESKDVFTKANPVLAKLIRSLGGAKQTKQCVYLDDLTHNYRDTKQYVSYLSHVLKLFSSMCCGRFSSAIEELSRRGLNAFHITTCLKQDAKHIHPKLMQAYVSLARTICVDIEPLTSICTFPNRCYLY
jgi:hypothetical protein